MPAVKLPQLTTREGGFCSQTWEELKASTGLDVPQLMVKKLPSTLRMDIKGQRDWFREQHGYLRCAPQTSPLPANVRVVPTRDAAAL